MNTLKFHGGVFLSKIQTIHLISDAVVRRCSVKKVFLKIWQNSQENNCIGVSIVLIKLQAFRSAFLLKRDSNTGVFLWILPNF